MRASPAMRFAVLIKGSSSVMVWGKPVIRDVATFAIATRVAA
jgi:hypothetical protein